MTIKSLSDSDFIDVESQRYVKVSKQQQQLWMLQNLYPDSPAYHTSAGLQIIGELNFEALDRSYTEVIRSYEVLRSCFAMENGKLRQIIGTPTDQYSIMREEFNSEMGAEPETAISEFIHTHTRMPFDLGQAPLIKAYLLNIEKNKNVFLIVAHQAIVDAESLEYILFQMSEVYNSFTTKVIKPELIQTPQYSEFVDYQAQELNRTAYSAKLEFWKRSVLSPNGFIDIPISQTRPSMQSFNGVIERYVLPDGVFENIRKLKRDTDIDLSTILINAFQILLFRYTKSPAISVGIPFPNRTIERFRNLVGPIENILPLNTDLKDSPTYIESLILTQNSLEAAANHQEVTLDSIVEYINPIRDSSYNPLYQVGFRFDSVSPLYFNKLEVNRIDCFNGTSVIDLLLHITEDSGRLYYSIIYNPELFTASSMAAFGEHYETLLAGILHSKETPIELLNILPENEKHKQLNEWNNTHKPHPVSRKIHELFEYQVSLHPNNIAVEYKTHALTYRELDRRANQMAHYLQKYEIAPNVLVGVCLERSCEMMVALLGVLKAGGGYIPMDPDYPKERLAYIAEHSNAPVLITQESLLSFIPETNAAIICIDRDWDKTQTCSNEKFSDKATHQDIAYVIYTSGSTGIPKGVQIPHGAVANLLNSMARQQGMGADDVLISVTTYSFDLSVPDLYLPLFAGGRTVFARTQIATNGTLLAQLLKDKHVTFMDATPSTWMLLLESGWEGSDQLTALCGGEAWPSKLAKELAPRVKTLWNMYGPTETTVWSTCFRIEPSDNPTVLIGKPIDNTSVYVLDDNLQPLPIGVPGELYIGGYGVSLGYLKRPELNAKCFIENPFKKEGHPRIYKTGDSVRFRPDGNIEYLNRLDNQVKVRGLRIELGEIEAVLAKYPGIKQMVVVVREDSPDDKRIVAYFVGEDGTPIKEADLRNHLKQFLPSYMVPQHLVALDALPRTPNGKIDRKALPSPQMDEGEKDDYRDPVHLVKQPLDKWLYRPVWKEAPLESRAEFPQAATCLIFVDETGIGEEVAKRLRAMEYDVITVASSDAYYKFDEHRYSINPEQGLIGYASLVSDLSGHGRIPNRIAHLWMVTDRENFRPGSSFFHRNLEHGYHSIIHLAQALYESALNQNIQIVTVLNGSQSVLGEHVPYPEKASILGPSKVIAKEFGQVRSRVIDIDAPTMQTQKLSLFTRQKNKCFAQLIENEMLLPAENETITYRNGRRYLKTYENAASAPSGREGFRPNGIYLIAGGLGKLGYRTAVRLRREYQARLVIVDLIELPDRREWERYLSRESRDHWTTDCIQKLLELDPDGDEVAFYTADIANAERMQEILSDAGARFGNINGVIHAATCGTDAPIFLQNDDKVERCFATMIGGTMVLDRLLSRTPLDFFVVYSSLENTMAEAGKSTEVAANAFLNAYAENCAALGRQNTFCLDWGTWQDTDEAAGTETPDDEELTDPILTPQQKFSRYMASQGIEPQEWWEMLKRSLSLEPGVLTVSPVDLSDYIEEIEKRGTGSGSELTAPRDDIEKRLAQFWKETIGIKNPGIRQIFFDVGGHSITAVRLFAKIKQEYNIQWPLSVLFQAPTIESCAKLVRDEIKGTRSKINESDAYDRFLVKMHDGSGNGHRPIFIAAGAFGNVLNLRHLAQQLGSERPVYGLQAKGLLGDDPPHETYEEAAADYLKEIRRIQPEGPYLLAGFCSGGTIAYEMAQQLIAEGEAVSHLVLLDTIAPDWREVLTRKDKITLHRKNFEMFGVRYPFVWVARRVAWEWGKLQERLGIDSEKTGPAVFRGRLIFDATLRAEDSYKPKAYAGKVVLFRPKLDQFVHLEGGRAINRKRDFVRSDNGWTPHIQQLEIQEISAEPGDHDGFVLEPAVRELSRRFKQFLQRE